MIDSHCHLDDERLAGERAALLVRARAAGVQGFLVAGVDERQWRRAEALTAGGLLCGAALAAGVHPWVAASCSEPELDGALDWLAKVARRALEWAERSGGRGGGGEDQPSGAPAEDGTAGGLTPCALGETGLDALRGRDPQARSLQQRAFLAHLELACETGLPLVLHVVRAHGEVLGLLRRFAELPGGVVHGFSGSVQEAQRYLDLGLYLGIGPPVTWRAPGRLAEVVRRCPAGRLLLETDAPDRPVQQAAGGPGEPAHLLHVARAVAALRDEPLEELAARTADNARRLFRLARWPAPPDRTPPTLQSGGCGNGAAGPGDHSDRGP